LLALALEHIGHWEQTLVYAESLVRDRMPPCRRKLRRRAVSSGRKIRASTSKATPVATSA